MILLDDEVGREVRAFLVGAVIGGCLGILLGMVAMALIARAML